ncbi:MAG: TM2 domain-containing protein [Clostridiales bacterium]|nr:TM2 domain-containing protein [Clostridiales bacterium]
MPGQTVQQVVVRGGKACNKTVALLLCICLGYFGAHKFYEGKAGTGLIYLCTFGLFGIGWLIDILALCAKPSTYYV